MNIYRISWTIEVYLLKHLKQCRNTYHIYIYSRFVENSLRILRCLFDCCCSCSWCSGYGTQTHYGIWWCNGILVWLNNPTWSFNWETLECIIEFKVKLYLFWVKLWRPEFVIYFRDKIYQKLVLIAYFSYWNNECFSQNYIRVFLDPVMNNELKV